MIKGEIEQAKCQQCKNQLIILKPIHLTDPKPLHKSNSVEAVPKDKSMDLDDLLCRDKDCLF